MSESGLTCKSFYNRKNCYYYKESKKYYIFQIEEVFKKIFKELNTSKISFITTAVNKFANRSYTGIKNVYLEDRSIFKKYCLDSMIFIDKFFNLYTPDKIGDTYNYKFKIKGIMDAVILKKKWNVSFCFRNYDDTNKILDFYSLNNYIYNQVNNISNDCLVVSVPDEVFYLIKYDSKDYTIKRGYLTSMNINKIKNRGYYCKFCKNNCKPTIIKGLNRLEVI